MNEFHKSFLKELVFVALVTVFCMGFSKYMINYYENTTNKPIIFTSQNP